jgi:hypothetical protein
MELSAGGSPLTASIARSSSWSEILGDVDFHLHARHAPATIRRFALGGTATLYPLRDAVAVETSVKFRDSNGGVAAIGFELDVDAAAFRLSPPTAIELKARSGSAPSAKSWRAAWLRRLTISDETLRQHANAWELDRLHDLHMTILVATALWSDDKRPVQLRVEAIRGIAAALGSHDDVGDDDDGLEAEPEGFFATQALYERPDVRSRLQVLLEKVTSDEAGWTAWLEDRLVATVSAAIGDAFAMLAPRHAAQESLTVDIGSRWPDDRAPDTIWVTELAGGGGTVEAGATATGSDARLLVDALDAAIAPSGSELAYGMLDRAVHLLVGDPEIRLCAAAVRNAATHTEREAARVRLFRAFENQGLNVDQSLSVALHHRLLRPGANERMDEVLVRLLKAAQQAEDQLGMAIDLRCLCAGAMAVDELRDAVADWLGQAGGGVLTSSQMCQVLIGLLWPRAHEVRNQTLASYSPYRGIGWVDAALVRELLGRDSSAPIVVGTAGWREVCREQLSANAAATLVGSSERSEQLKAAVAALLAEPVDVDFLQFFPTVERVEKQGRDIEVQLVLRELV